MTNELDIALFRKRAFETATWSNLRLQSEDESKISPNLLRRLVSEPTKPLLFFTQQERDNFIDTLFEVRTDKLHEIMEIDPLKSETSDYSKGRLLAFFPYRNVNDGVAKIESKHFFDNGGYPPWDTWIYYIKAEDETNSEAAHIIAWVPPVFIELANDGIKYSPDNSLGWLKNSDLSFSYIETLAEADLLV